MGWLRTAGTATALVALGTVTSAAYVIQPGDTLSAIAGRSGTTVAALVQANDLADPDHIVAGERLKVPRAETSTPTAAGTTWASRADAGRLIAQVARERGWSPRFVQALAWQESGWQMDVTSSAGAIGIMQVMPETGEFVSDHLVGRPLDLRDPHDNITAGVAFLQFLYDLTGGDVKRTLGGYYQGLRSIDANGMRPDTRRYIANVLALRDRM